MSNVGDEFQQQTKYRSDRMTGEGQRWNQQPQLYKSYPGHARVVLPVYRPGRLMSLDEALKARTSVREYKAEPMALGQLGYLLWASTGIQRTEQGYEFRTSPSAGALYPIETFVIVNAVRELEPGVYHYGIRNHELEEIRGRDLRRQLAGATLGQSMCAKASAAFVWTALFARSKWKYGQRAYRYVYLEAGHMAENLALAAVSLGLGTCQIGAIFDDDVNKLLDVDGVEESVVYMSVAGVPAQGGF